MPIHAIREPEKWTKIREECDVLVAGAGTAGVAAAIAAARSGAKTILIEQLPLPCGTMTNGGIIFNSFYSTYCPDSPNPKKVVAGIAHEIVDRVIEAGGCPGFTKLDERKNAHHRPYIVVMDSEIYKVVIARMLEEAGAKLYLHTFLSDAVVEDNVIKAVIIQSKSGREAIAAKCYIDSTGDGDLAALSGAENYKIHSDYVVHNVGKILSISNVDIQKFVDFAREDGMLSDLAQGKKFSDREDNIRIEVNFAQSKTLAQKAAAADLRVLLFLSIHDNHIDYVNFLGKSGVDVTDVEELSKVELDMQEVALKMYYFAKQNLPGFENSVFSHTGNQIGIRASRVVKCDYSLSNDDIINSMRFEDEIGLFGYHDLAPLDPTGCAMKNKGYYGLPYRMLLPRGVENLYVTGRMVTEGSKPHMSTRNTASCMVQGQAAGTAAALCAQQNVLPRELNYGSLRKALENSGVLFAPIEQS